MNERLRVDYLPGSSSFAIHRVMGDGPSDPDRVVLSLAAAKALAAILMSGTRSVENKQGFKSVDLTFKPNGNILIDRDDKPTGAGCLCYGVGCNKCEPRGA